MTEDSWQVSSTAAEVYEAKFVAAIFRDWAPRIVDELSLKPDSRVLDVACGTGVVARECARRGAKVTGLDINEGMLQMARRVAPDVEWRQGDAGNLPFGSATFDAVVCQFGLMFFPDPVKALYEQWRVLKPGGRLALSVWDGMEKMPVYRTMAELVERHGDRDVWQAFVAPFRLGDAAEIERLLVSAEIGEFKVKTLRGHDRYHSVEDFVDTQIKASPLAERFDEESFQALMEDARRVLAKLNEGETGLAYSTSAHMVSAQKADN